MRVDLLPGLGYIINTSSAQCGTSNIGLSIRHHTNWSSASIKSPVQCSVLAVHVGYDGYRPSLLLHLDPTLVKSVRRSVLPR